MSTKHTAKTYVHTVVSTQPSMQNGQPRYVPSYKLQGGMQHVLAAGRWLRH